MASRSELWCDSLSGVMLSSPAQSYKYAPCIETQVTQVAALESKLRGPMNKLHVYSFLRAHIEYKRPCI